MMFGIDQVFSEWVKVILSLSFIGVIIWRCGGISVLFRLLLRAAGINFKKGALGKADDEIFYTQKFALLNGVKVENTRDAKLLTKGLLCGRISKNQFYFTSFFGVLGKTKSSSFDTWLLVVLGSIFLVFFLSLLATFPNKGYTNYNHKNLTIQISREDIIISKGLFEDSMVLNENDCMQIIKTHSHDVYRTTCEYIALKDERKEADLINAINSWDDLNRVSKIAFLFLFTFFITLTFGSINHRNLNDYIFDCKKNNHLKGINEFIPQDDK